MDKVKEMVRLRDEGLRDEEIAERLGVHVAWVRAVLKSDAVKRWAGGEGDAKV